MGYITASRFKWFPAGLRPRNVPPQTLPQQSRWGGGVTADEMGEMQWVRPELVAQIRVVEWTAEGLLRLVLSPRSLE